MANIRFSRKLFEKEIGKLDKTMQNKIAMFGTTLESFDDEEIEIEVFPNRPDLLSYQGFKRSFLGFLGKEKGIKKYKINPPEKDYVVKIDSSLKKIRPYTACAVIKGLKFKDEKIKEIIEIQEKLHNTIGRKRKKIAIGIYPLEKIKFPITFKALEPDKIKFVPLEMEKELSGLEILQRHPTGREYAHLLAGKEKFPIFIDAKGDIMSMPPIINSNLTGKITEKTKDVFVECSGFDFEIAKKCLNIIVTTLADMGGKIYQIELKGEVNEKTPDLTPQETPLSIENANKILGLELDEKQIKELLGKMGHEYEKGIVKSPAWRTDILHEIDLIEDIAIAYGYENFEAEIPEISTIGEEDKKETIKRKIAEILSGLGLLETSSYHLTKPEDMFKKMNVPEKMKNNYLEVEDSKTDYTLLRKNLTHCLLRIFSENSDSEYPQKIFESGRVFELQQGKIIEKESLSVAVIPSNFTEIKQILNYLFKMLDLEIEIKETENFSPWFIDGRVAEIRINNKKIGEIGEIHPKILRNWKLKYPVALFEIELEEIFELIKEEG